MRISKMNYRDNTNNKLKDNEKIYVWCRNSTGIVDDCQLQ